MKSPPTNANLVLAAVAATVGLVASPLTAGIGAAWVGPATGNWNDAINWSPVGVPNGVPVSIAPRGGASVLLNSFGLAYPSIFVGQGSEVVHPMSMFITVSDLELHGTWRFENGSPFVSAIFIAEDLSLDGTGALDFGNNLQNRLVGSGTVRHLVNGGLHTIRGGGGLGSNSITFLNLGLVEATAPNAALEIDLAEGDNRNEATMIARSGSTLRFLDTSIDNSSGAILAAAGGVVELTGSTIQGGELASVGSGFVSTVSTASTIADLLVDGELRVPYGSELRLTGTIVNEGLIRTLGAPAFAIVRCQGSTALEGSGTLRLGGSPSFDLLLGDASATLEHGAAHSIRGGGSIGGMALVNHGAIESDGFHTIDLSLVAAPTVNDGVIGARESGTLRLIGGTYLNAGGEIRAIDAGVVRLQGTTIAGGLLATAASGGFLVPGLGGDVVSTIADATIAGTVTVESAGALDLAGTIENNGLLTNFTTTSPAWIRCATDVELGGSGSLQLRGGTSFAVLQGRDATRLLTNGPDHTIRGWGGLGTNTFLDILNLGSIVADDVSGAFVGAELRIDASGSFVNEGLIRVAGPGFITIEPSGFSNRGAVVVDAGRELRCADEFLQESGSTRVDGSLVLLGSIATLEGGALGGGGGISGPVTNIAGRVEPSLGENEPARTLGLGGSYDQAPGGTLAVRLEPGASDRLAVAGAATLAGTLAIELAPGYQPLPGESFTVLTAASVSGGFDCVRLPASAEHEFDVVIGPTSVTLVASSRPFLAADLDGDGVASGADLGLLLSAWGDQECAKDPCCQADLDHDGFVDGADLALLLASWN